MYNSTKSNVLVFCSKLLKNVHVSELEINNTAIDRVSMYKYLGNCINDLLLSCPSHNCFPLAGACHCPLCHCGQVVSRAGLV